MLSIFASEETPEESRAIQEAGGANNENETPGNLPPAPAAREDEEDSAAANIDQPAASEAVPEHGTFGNTNQEKGRISSSRRLEILDELKCYIKSVTIADAEAEPVDDNYLMGVINVVTALIWIDFPKTGWSHTVPASIAHPTGAELGGKVFGPNTMFRFEVPQKFGESFQKGIFVYLFVQIMMGKGPCPTAVEADKYLPRGSIVPEGLFELAQLFGVSRERLVQVGTVRQNELLPNQYFVEWSYTGFRRLFNKKAIRPGTIKEFVFNLFAFEGVKGYDGCLPKRSYILKRRGTGGNDSAPNRELESLQEDGAAQLPDESQTATDEVALDHPVYPIRVRREAVPDHDVCDASVLHMRRIYDDGENAAKAQNITETDAASRGATDDTFDSMEMEDEVGDSTRGGQDSGNDSNDEPSVQPPTASNHNRQQPATKSGNGMEAPLGKRAATAPDVEALRLEQPKPSPVVVALRLKRPKISVLPESPAARTEEDSGIVDEGGAFDYDDIGSDLKDYEHSSEPLDDGAADDGDQTLHPEPDDDGAMVDVQRQTDAGNTGATTIAVQEDDDQHPEPRPHNNGGVLPDFATSNPDALPLQGPGELVDLTVEMPGPIGRIVVTPGQLEAMVDESRSRSIRIEYGTIKQSRVTYTIGLPLADYRYKSIKNIPEDAWYSGGMSVPISHLHTQMDDPKWVWFLGYEKFVDSKYPCALLAFANEGRDGSAVIKLLWVDAIQRRKGFATKLIQCAMPFMSDNSFLQSGASDSDNAIAWYKHHGMISKGGGNYGINMEKLRGSIVECCQATWKLENLQFLVDLTNSLI